MRFSSVTAHYHYDVSVFDIHPVVGHRTATNVKEQDLLPLVRVRRAPGCLPPASRGSGQIFESASRFRCWHRSTQHTGRKPTVYCYALLVLFNKVSVTVSFHQLFRNTGECFFPANALPFVRTWRTIFRVAQTVFAVDVIQQTGPFSGTAHHGLPDDPGHLQCDKSLLWRFSRHHPGYTSIARNLRNSMCRCYGSL